MSLLEIIKRLNWVDIVVVILFARICYVGVSSGVLFELFKLLGTVFATYLSLHYYAVLGRYSFAHLGIKLMPQGFLDVFAFILLAFTGYLILFLLRQIFVKYVKLEPAAGLHKWGGFVCGLFRGLLLISLILFVFLISPIGYFRSSVTSSFLGKAFSGPAPSTYAGIWNGAMSKFATGEKFNSAVPETLKAFDKK